MKNVTKLFSLLAMTFAVLFTACDQQESEPTQPTENGEATIGISAVMEAAFSQAITGGREDAESTITGTMTATNLDSGDEQVFDWYAVIDEDAFTVESTKTIVLVPGNYDFDLVLSDGTHSYAGQALLETVSEGENTIDLTLKPVFGDVDVDFTIQESANLKFSYPVEDISELDNPIIGISIDGGDEMVYALNPNTGFSDTWINVSFGSHTFVLTLSDGGTLVGRSVPSQETVNVQRNTNIAMDIVPLYGEVAFDLDLEGGELTFNFELPFAVADEVGGASNLQTVFRMTSTVNGNQEVNLNFVDQGDVIDATHTFTDFRYDIVNLALVFIDAATGDEVGYATYSGLALGNADQNITLEIDLRRRALITGNVLAVVGVNVFDQNNAAVPGADVFIDGEFVGITGSGTFGTAGYLKLYLKQGDYTVTAVNPVDGYFGEESLSVAPLDVTNIDIILDTEPMTLGMGLLNRDGFYGYQGSASTQFTGIVDSEFSTVDVVGDFEDLNQLLQYRALVLDLPSNGSFTLSASEMSNIQSYVASGGKVLVIGDQTYFQGWNESIAVLVGGTYVHQNTQGAISRVNVVPGLNANAATLSVAGATKITGGGTVLYGTGEVVLWGDKLLTQMDVDITRDGFIAQQQNAIYTQDVITWLNN